MLVHLQLDLVHQRIRRPGHLRSSHHFWCFRSVAASEFCSTLAPAPAASTNSPVKLGHQRLGDRQLIRERVQDQRARRETLEVQHVRPGDRPGIEHALRGQQTALAQVRHPRRSDGTRRHRGATDRTETQELAPCAPVTSDSRRPGRESFPFVSTLQIRETARNSRCGAPPARDTQKTRIPLRPPLDDVAIAVRRHHYGGPVRSTQPDPSVGPALQPRSLSSHDSFSLKT